METTLVDANILRPPAPAAWGMVLGIPSKNETRSAQSGCATRSADNSDDHFVGHQLARDPYNAFAFRPVSVPFWIASRRMFPVEMVGMPSFSADDLSLGALACTGSAQEESRFITISPLITQESPCSAASSSEPRCAVDSLQRNADHDDDGGTANGQAGIVQRCCRR